MAKSKITKYYEERLRYRLQPEPPTAEEALDAIDFEKGIDLIEELSRISEELNEWLHDYTIAVSWSDIPKWQRGLDTLRPIQRILNENKGFLPLTARNFARWQKKQSGEPNIIYKAS